MTVLLDDNDDLKKGLPFNDDELLNKAIDAVLSLENFPDNAEISVSYVGEAVIREINRENRGIDSATDVLSFPMIEYDGGYSLDFAISSSIDTNHETKDIMLGDIVLCIPRVISQAEEYGHSIIREFVFLIVHSMLHLLGYDHIKENERVVMEERQKDIMSFLQISRKERQ